MIDVTGGLIYDRVMRQGLAAGICLMVTVAACGDGDGKASTEASPSPAASRSTPMPEPETATVEQYSSIIARTSDVSDQITIMEDCDWLGNGPLDYDPNSFVCFAGVLTMQYLALNVRTRLQDARDESSADFIGEPPGELVSLVGETIAAAGELEAAAGAAHESGCHDSGRGKCGRLRLETFQAMSGLEFTLSAWEPYL